MNRAENILQHIDEITAKRKIRIRNRRVRSVISCPPFYKKVGTACIQDTPTEARRISFRRKLAWRNKTRKKVRQLITHRNASLALRASVFGAPPPSSGTQRPPNEFFATVKHLGAMKRLLAVRMRQQGKIGAPILTSQAGVKGKVKVGAQIGIPTTTPISQSIAVK